MWYFVEGFLQISLYQVKLTVGEYLKYQYLKYYFKYMSSILYLYSNVKYVFKIL